MRQHETELKQLNVEVCVVTFDADVLATNYVQETQLPWPLLLDRDRQLYGSYQMQRAAWWAIYGPASIWHYFQLLLRGRRLQKPGDDWRQVGGDVLIDSAGVVRFHYVSGGPHDRPAVERMLAVVQEKP